MVKTQVTVTEMINILETNIAASFTNHPANDRSWYIDFRSQSSLVIAKKSFLLELVEDAKLRLKNNTLLVQVSIIIR